MTHPGEGDLSAFILEWLIWPERVAAWQRYATLPAASDPDYGFRSAAFRNRIGTAFRHLKADDIEAIADAIAHGCEACTATGAAVLPWLYRQCLADAGAQIRFSNGVPVIDCRSAHFERWLALAERIDPDALICLALASECRAGQFEATLARIIPEWPIVCGTADHDLHQLFARGVTDIHLHLKSAWPVALSWQRVLPYAVARGEGRRLDKLAASGDFKANPAEWRCLKNVLGVAGHGRDLETLRAPTAPFFRTADVLPMPVGKLLSAERGMLTKAWLTLLHQADGSGRLEAELDEYIVAKSLFRHRHTQPSATSNRGLIAFDKYRRANSHLGRFDREEAGKSGFSNRRFRRNNAFLFLALRDSRALRKMEVRIAPPIVAAARLTKTYGQTLVAIDRLVEALSGDPSDGSFPEVKVALHFKRMIPEPHADRHAMPGHAPDPTTPILKKMLEYDRDTASFQNLRVRAYQWQAQASNGDRAPSHVRALDRVSRVDLASPERGAGPWLIAPYIRLLKGDTALLDQLGRPESRAYFPKWSELYQQTRAHPPFGSPDFGLTCHAGEDFYTLVDGLWHVEGALSGWRLGPGDALGHCLALGLNPQAHLETLEHIRVPAGVELDSMIWLRGIARQAGFANLAVMHRIESWILERAAAIYRDRASFPVDLAALDAKIAAAAEPLLVPNGFSLTRLPAAELAALPDWLSPGYRLRLLDVFSRSVALRRHQRKRPTALHKELLELIRQIQGELIAVICSKGVTIETNPSSNMRMERIRDPASLPICGMLDRDGPRPRITICTDNPGTYDISIETEYALMFSALLKRLGPDRRDEAIAHLERMRSAGQTLFDSF